LHSGITPFITPSIIATTKYYVSVSGTDYCENEENDRAEVTVTVTGSAFVDDVWYYGENGEGIRFTSNGTVYVAGDASGESQVRTHENSLVVSSPYCEGQVIFYSSHNQLYNSLHALMPHGRFMGHQSVADGLAACYMSNNKYLLFSVTDAYEGANRGLKAYIVDMNADYGKGDIIDSLEIEPHHTYMSESIELLTSDTEHKYWLIYAYKTSSRHEVRVREVNVSNPANPTVSGVISSIATSTTYSHNTYTLKSSPQHDRIAVANADDETVDVFNFNYATGALMFHGNTSAMPVEQKVDGIAYGVEFSPDGNQLYVAGYSKVGTLKPNLVQYTITPTGLTFVDSIRYWATTESSTPRGGGLKLGPDGKIYVMLSYDAHAGVVSNPNIGTKTLSTRYNRTGLSLNVNPYSYGLQFSTGLTRPSEMECNTNQAPVANPDAAVAFCVTASSRTVEKNVLRNDTDADNNTIYLTGAEFVNASDADLAEITVDAADSTISLTIKPDAYISVSGHVFEIIYHVKDNGAPASQCSMGIFTVTVYPTPSFPDIRVRVCPGVSSVNLAKYIDTVFKASDIQWGGAMSGAISSSGEISMNSLSQIRVHTFTYTVNSLCGGKQTRKYYLEILKNKRALLPKDTVVVCYKYAESMHIDQLFGLAGGTLTPSTGSHITTSSGGAVVMNGKALYEAGHTDSYRGKNDVKIITFTYTPDSGACLLGTEYKITIVLTDDIGS
jgi:hypothetical protein